MAGFILAPRFYGQQRATVSQLSDAALASLLCSGLLRGHGVFRQPSSWNQIPLPNQTVLDLNESVMGRGTFLPLYGVGR